MWSESSLKIGVALTLLFLASPPRAFSQGGAAQVLVPKDTTFALELLSPISTKTNKKGDKFECKVLSPVEYAGAVVSGHLRKVKNSGKANGKSEMDMAFDTITLSDGRVAGFNAQVKEVNDVANAANAGLADPEGTVKGKSRVKISVKRAAAGALIGGLIGGAVAGPKGAIVGAAIGAGVAVTSKLATEGPNLEFKAGTQFTVTTNSPSRGKGKPTM
jgi:hypothetical protein